MSKQETRQTISLEECLPKNRGAKGRREALEAMAAIDEVMLRNELQWELEQEKDEQDNE
ncbi:hypothetical protein KKB41_04025 [Patescibacteria group bacterium]|nr:hypothetical protein [Patescibacteria group bacterium]